MDYYLLEYDNGESYELNDREVIGVFDDLKILEKLIVSKGFARFEVDGFFKREQGDYAIITTMKLNEINKELRLSVEFMGVE